MARHRQRPTQVEAIQFTGGEENAAEVIKWLSGKQQRGQWIDNHTVLNIHLVECLNFREVISPNNVTIIRTAYRGDWIVRMNKKWRVFSKAEFGERFEQI